MYDQYEKRITGFKLGNIIFSVKAVYKALLCLLLLLPESFFSFAALYSSTTPGYINYKWLDYKFGIVQLIILIIGCLLLFSHKNKLIPSLFVLFLARELLISTYTDKTIFNNNAYEMYLAFFVGVAFIELLISTCSSIKEVENTFLLIVLLNILTLYPRVVLNLTGIDGRYNISNLDVGMTGTFCGIAFMLALFDRECRYRIFQMITSIVGIFISGSRVNLVIFTLILILGVIINTARMKSINKISWIRGLIISFCVLAVFIGVYIYLNVTGTWTRLINGLLSSRMLSTFNSRSMESDSSFIGRSESLAAGLNIIKTYPGGISGYFINLQTETILRGFPTFPHSSLMDAYILFGPIILILLIYIICNLIRLYRISFHWFIALLYMLVFITISGGPIVNFKIIFFYGMILYITSEIISSGKDDEYEQVDLPSA